MKSRSLIKGMFNSRKAKVEDGQGGGYGDVVQQQRLQEINMESDLRCNDAGTVYADVGAKEGDRNIYDIGIGAAGGTYTGARGRIDGITASLCTRDSTDEQHGISRVDECSASGRGDQHSSCSRGGICAAAGGGDRGCSATATATATYDSSFGAVKAGIGYAASTVELVKSAGNAAGGDQSEGCAAATAGKMRRRKKFVGVRQRPSGRWVAEIKDTTQKIRMWLGTFDTAEDAARAYDEAACLLRGSNTRTNFIPSVPSSPSSSPLASRLAHMLRARQNQNITSESSSPLPSSPPPATATTEPSHRNPLEFSSSHNNPLSSSAYSHNKNPMESSNNSAKQHPNCTNSKQNANPHTNHFPQNSFHNPYRKTDGSRQQHAPMFNHGYSLQLLHPHTEAQSNLFELMSKKSSKAQNSPLWRSSRSESESSDSDPSPPHADYFPILKRHRTNLHDHFQILSRYKAGFANVHGCNKSANGMPGYLGKEMSGELSGAHINPSNEDMNWDDHKQIFARDKNLISAEDIDTLTHDQHSMRTNHNYHHNYRGGGFMDALMGINDDIILDPSEQMESMASSYYSNQNVSPFDFNVEASLGPNMMQVDEFPMINELSGKLEEAEGGLHYVNLHGDEEGSNHSSSSSNVMHDTTQDNANLGSLQLSGNLDGNFVCGINSDLEMKRMRFERRASASLYALNGVHEMAMKQAPCQNPGTNYLLAGNSTSTSFNFLSTSPSYIMLSSPWKPSSASSTTSTCDDSIALNAGCNVNGAVINTPSLMPSNSSPSNCPSDTIASNSNSTLTFSNMGSDDTSNIGITNSSTNNNSSDAQSQEAAMWNSWDLAPLCTLVA